MVLPPSAPQPPPRAKNCVFPATSIPVETTGSAVIPLESPSFSSCLICMNSYDNNRFQLSCCQKHACINCMGTWFIHYGKTCPFCKDLKIADSPEINRFLIELYSRPKVLQVVSESCPSRRISTNPLLSQGAIIVDIPPATVAQNDPRKEKQVLISFLIVIIYTVLILGTIGVATYLYVM